MTLTPSLDSLRLMSRAKCATHKVRPAMVRVVHVVRTGSSVFLTPLVLSCGLRNDCTDGHAGQVFELRITKRLTSSCGVPSTDRLIGKSFRFRVEGFSDGDVCGCGIGPILQSPDDRTWSDSAPQMSRNCRGGFFGVTVKEQLGSCTSDVRLGVHAEGPGTADLNDPTPDLRLDYASTCDCTGSFYISLQRVNDN
jgi:hypothetical protein